MKARSLALLVGAAILLSPSARADLTAAQVPAFRGLEATAYAGWADWNAVLPGGTLPDDPATTAAGARVYTNDPGVIGVGGVVCIANPAEVAVTYGDPALGVITEVVVQVRSTNLASAHASLAYTIPFSPDPDYAAPVEVTDLAPDERLYRFRTSARGLTTGTLQPIEAFTFLLTSNQVLCVDEIQLDVRHVLEGQVQTVCPPTLNSELVGAGIDATGSSDVIDNDFTLTASGVPTGSFGIFLASTTTGLSPCPGGCAANQGTLCLGGTIARIGPVRQAGMDQSFSTPLDLTALPFSPPVAVTAGSTWYFQGWYRDANPAPTSNMTLSLGVTFR